MAAGWARGTASCPVVTHLFVMVATRTCDYDATGPQTRAARGPARVAHRLLKRRAEPQRLRRSYRMSTHPDVNHYVVGHAEDVNDDAAGEDGDIIDDTAVQEGGLDNDCTMQDGTGSHDDDQHDGNVDHGRESDAGEDGAGLIVAVDAGTGDAAGMADEVHAQAQDDWSPSNAKVGTDACRIDDASEARDPESCSRLCYREGPGTVAGRSCIVGGVSLPVWNRSFRPPRKNPNPRYVPAGSRSIGHAETRVWMDEGARQAGRGAQCGGRTEVRIVGGNSPVYRAVDVVVAPNSDTPPASEDGTPSTTRSAADDPGVSPRLAAPASTAPADEHLSMVELEPSPMWPGAIAVPVDVCWSGSVADGALRAAVPTSSVAATAAVAAREPASLVNDAPETVAAANVAAKVKSSCTTAVAVTGARVTATAAYPASAMASSVKIVHLMAAAVNVSPVTTTALEIVRATAAAVNNLPATAAAVEVVPSTVAACVLTTVMPSGAPAAAASALGAAVHPWPLSSAVKEKASWSAPSTAMPASAASVAASPSTSASLDPAVAPPVAVKPGPALGLTNTVDPFCSLSTSGPAKVTPAAPSATGGAGPSLPVSAVAAVNQESCGTHRIASGSAHARVVPTAEPAVMPRAATAVNASGAAAVGQRWPLPAVAPIKQEPLWPVGFTGGPDPARVVPTIKSAAVPAMTPAVVASTEGDVGPRSALSPAAAVKQEPLWSAGYVRGTNSARGVSSVKPAAALAASASAPGPVLSPAGRQHVPVKQERSWVVAEVFDPALDVPAQAPARLTSAASNVLPSTAPAPAASAMGAFGPHWPLPAVGDVKQEPSWPVASPSRQHAACVVTAVKPAGAPAVAASTLGTVVPPWPLIAAVKEEASWSTPSATAPAAAASVAASPSLPPSVDGAGAPPIALQPQRLWPAPLAAASQDGAHTEEPASTRCCSSTRGCTCKPGAPRSPSCR